MVVFYSISIGLCIAVFSLIMIRREVMKASFFKHIKPSDNMSEDLVRQVQLLEEKVDEMNQSFYKWSRDYWWKDEEIHLRRVKARQELRRFKNTSAQDAIEEITFRGLRLSKSEF